MLSASVQTPEKKHVIILQWKLNKKISISTYIVFGLYIYLVIEIAVKNKWNMFLYEARALEQDIVPPITTSEQGSS